MKKPLEIYIHIPFCVKKCNYCDFLSFASTPEIIRSYVNRLLKEIEEATILYEEESADDYEVCSVFIGGGTPSILQAGEINRVLCKLKERFVFKHNAEISMEMNPGTVTSTDFQIYKRAGINRLSFGLQSTKDDELRVLGRIHTYADFEEAFLSARNAGFDNINIDIMTAIPMQTADSLCETLERVIAKKPEHISAYSLIIEPGTPFYGAHLELPDEDTERRMYEITGAKLKEAGYHHYEISNYALPSFACVHNCGYWTGTDYLAFGLGASSMVQHVRWKNTENMFKYMEETSIRVERQELSIEEQMEEFMFLGLRLMEGVSITEFELRFGKKMKDTYGNQIEILKKDALVTEKNGRIMLTSYGIDISNYVFEKFLLDSTCKIES